MLTHSFTNGNPWPRQQPSSQPRRLANPKNQSLKICEVAVQTHTLPGCKICNQLSVLGVVVDDDHEAVTCVKANHVKELGEHSRVGKVGAASASCAGD